MNDHNDFDTASGALPELTFGSVIGAQATSQVDFEIGFYRGVLERDPNYVEALRVLGNNLSAKGLHTEGLEIDQRIVRLRPYDSVAAYNLACSYSMTGMVEFALDSLKRAIELGYDEFEYMRIDSDLEITRRDPRFLELLKSVGVGHAD